MASLATHSMSSPHETRPFAAHGQIDVVTIGDFSVGKGVFESGWRWSNDVKPIMKTDSCMAAHSGICTAGAMTVLMDDGTEETISAGDAFTIPPGHDAWTVGDEACVLYDTSVKGYAKPS